ncbi:MAG: hypothetical protein AB2A00_25255 [Myxococcota bacterium]
MDSQAPVRFVELVSVFILGAFVLAQPRAERKGFLKDALIIGLAAVLGEETCIAFYEFYRYSPLWSVKVLEVPVMVGCIWPAVVLSARQVVRAVRGDTHPLAVAGVVLFDATLVEAVSVRTGLWQWIEGAVFEVPIIGLVGWAAYAGAASAVMDHVSLSPGRKPTATPVVATWLRLLVPPLVAHLVLLATWWGALRWMLRAPLSATVLATLSAVVALLLTVVLWKKRGTVPLSIMGPRAAAAVLFFLLVGLRGTGALELAMFTVPFAVPYVVMTRWSARVSHTLHTVA